MTYYLGTQGWSYADWVGVFYPPGTKSGDFLELYSRVFDAVELDTTFYGIPSSQRVERWRKATPDGFQFTAKLPRSITHDRHLVDSADELREFLAAVSELESKLGAVLIQLPPDFTADEAPALQAFLPLLPSDIRFAAEFRHRSWLRPETLELLSAHGVAWTMIDLPYMPIRTDVTTDLVYIRLLGDHRKIIRMNETQIDRRPALDRWAEVIEDVARRSERTYVFANNHYSGHSPADVRYLRKALGLPESAGDDIPESPVQRKLL